MGFGKKSFWVQQGDINSIFAFLRYRLAYSEQYGGHFLFLVVRKVLISFLIILINFLCQIFA